MLGHIIDDDGLKLAPDKISKIENWTNSKMKKQLQEFQGTVNNISQFLPHLATVTAPLTVLTRTGKFIWTPTQDQAMTNVKQLVSRYEVMKPINHESGEPIWLITDVSDTGVGAWVGQGPTSDTVGPAALYS